MHVDTDGEAATLVVEDDGRGVDRRRIESGLSNVRMRAQELGGATTISSGNDGGTRLCWRVPLSVVDVT
ncbi:hypothetical protein [Nocardioides alcanivorans]|uniref:hypothetical protein n=1 Tax=Nocardioides alcanivorans TaxID=2897352 RepID=UPI0035E3AAC7